MHQKEMLALLYPQAASAKDSLKMRQHAVDSHPVYNFIHTYYRFPVSKLLAYSPGIGVILEGAERQDLADANIGNNAVNNMKKTANSSGGVLSAIGVHYEEGGRGVFYSGFDRIKLETVKRSLDILVESSIKPPVFSCFGLHEWAMLYSGRREKDGPHSPLSKHQALPLRVSQEVLDDLVEGKTAGCSLKCTHYDAFRFFHPSAMGLNLQSDLSRASQVEYEQPGCIHSTMDLFKYAYTLYPYVPASLLRESLQLAIVARKIDMRSSPYDVSGYMDAQEWGDGCGDGLAICVETAEGRRQFALEQEKLYQRSLHLRVQLIHSHEMFLRNEPMM